MKRMSDGRTDGRLARACCEESGTPVPGRACPRTSVKRSAPGRIRGSGGRRNEDVPAGASGERHKPRSPPLPAISHMQCRWEGVRLGVWGGY